MCATPLSLTSIPQSPRVQYAHAKTAERLKLTSSQIQYDERYLNCAQTGILNSTVLISQPAQWAQAYIEDGS